MPMEIDCWLSEIFDSPIYDISIKIKYELEIEYLTEGEHIHMTHLELAPNSIELFVDGLGKIEDKSWTVSRHLDITNFVRSHINRFNLNDIVERLPYGDSRDHEDKGMYE